MQDILYLTHRIPYPPNKGDKLRSYHLLKFLAQRYKVHLGCFVDDSADRKYIGKVKALCHETCFIDQHPLRARVRSLRGLLTREALSLPYYRDRRMHEWVDMVLRTRPVQAALVFSSPMAQYMQDLDSLHRVIDFVDVDSEKWRQYADTKPWPLSQVYRREARRLLAYERQVSGQFACSTFVSDSEAALFRTLAPECGDKVDFYNNGVDTEYFSPHVLHPDPYPHGTTAIVFTGAMDYWPNAEAVDWFARTVFPHLYGRNHALRFYVVGARPSSTVQALGRLPGVVVTGAVADVRPFLAYAALAVAPLRIARGIQNKVLEAMAMQKAVVATPQALEGIGAQAGMELFVAADAADFARQIRYLLASPPSMRDLGLSARARVLKDYSWANNLGRLASMLEAQQEPA